MAQQYGFSKVYNHLKEFFSESWAYRLTCRVKRGMVDTSKPGGVTRDYSYIEGYLKVKDMFEQADEKEFMRILYTGKIGLEHVDLLKDIPGLKQPKYLPKNQSFKSLLSF